MLPHHICLLRDLGLNVRWLVFQPKEDGFFRFTKGLHNSLHDISAASLSDLLPYYCEASEQGAKDLAKIIEPDDLLVIHDPQPLFAAAQFLRLHPHPAIWRCHIGYPKSTPTVNEIWRMLTKYLAHFRELF